MNRLRGLAVRLLTVVALILLGPCQAAPEFNPQQVQLENGFLNEFIERELARNLIEQIKPTDFDPPFDSPTIFEEQGLHFSAEAELSDASTDPGFQLHKTKVLAAFESISYCRDEPSMMLWNCTRCKWKEVAGFLPEETVYDPKWDVFAFVGYFPQWKSIILAIRGTNSHDMWNWIEDFDSWRSKYPLPYPGAKGAQIHSGFYKLWAQSDLKSNVTAAMARLVDRYGTNVTTYVIGHSMGGAMADLCALWLKFNMSLTDVRVMTFGQPRTGNKKFSKFYRETIKNSWRLTHDKDIVPALPWMIMGYWHTPREVWQVDVPSGGGVNATFRVCNGSGEDPTCHDSVCRFIASCTSIDDHMVYLGYPMYTNSTLC